MWVMTKDGFLSIVQHKDMPWMMMVRARVREDLVNAFGEDSIVEDEQADYRFRKSVHRETVTNYMTGAVADVDYTTGVKDNIDQDDQYRHRALYKVWNAFYELQERKYGPGQHLYTVYGEPLVGEVKVAPPIAEDAVVIDDFSSLFDPSDDKYLT